MHLYIIASPRTGSTVLYQVLCKVLTNYVYITNEWNDKFVRNSKEYINKNLKNYLKYKKLLSFNSSYGKTEQYFEPSEGSALFTRWFGGGHPSEIVSKDFIPGMKKEFTEIHNYIFCQKNKYLITKNAWNCFRINTLSKISVPIFFIWLKRNLFETAISDLEARYRLGDPGLIWNSATTANYKEIQKLSPYEQVLEQQYYYNLRIKEDLEVYAPSRYISINFEELCKHPSNIILEIINKLNISLVDDFNDNIPDLLKPTKKRIYVTKAEEEIIHNLIIKSKKYIELF